jgi:ribonuclease HII
MQEQQQIHPQNNRKQQRLQRLNQLRQFDREIRLLGFPILAGIDEAGRGPLAGPVVAAAVVLPEDWSCEGIDDSKKLSESQRTMFYDEIKKNAISIGVGCISETMIDRINILQSTYLAMKEAVSQLHVKPDCLVLDAVRLPDCTIIQKSFIKGDGKSFSIASASIIAKVTRDRMMQEYDKKYPHYGFAQHKGYGTKLHYAALLNHGPCPIHRKSFLGKLNPIEFH